MNILEINKFYFLKGGAERYLFEVSDLLREHGHGVIPFAMQDDRNHASRFADHFPPHRETERVTWSLDGLRTATNLLYSRAAKRDLASLIRAAQPQVAHVHNIYHQLSSSVLDALREARIPAVMTVHDFRLLSPNYSLFHDGSVCERGIRNPFEIVSHRCIKRSYLASFVTALESAVVRSRHSYETAIGRFLVPSCFVYDRFKDAGWDMRRFVILPHFIDAEAFVPNDQSGSDVVAFGRLAPEKGFATLIEAARALPRVTFRVIGAGPEEAHLRALASDLMNVKFLGRLDGDALKKAVASAAIVVVPSIAYETFGFAALEAMALGKPVIASRIGALPELVRDGETGLLTAPGNVGELVQAIASLLASSERASALGRTGRAVAEREYTPGRHYAGLMEALSDVMGIS